MLIPYYQRNAEIKGNIPPNEKQEGPIKKILIYPLQYSVFILWIACILSPLVTLAQQPQQVPVLSDTIRIKADTTLAPADTLKKKRDIETTVKYTSRDSIGLDAVNQVTRLYGEARITYGEITLEADYIEFNYRNSLVYAKGITDSTGKVIGTPVFKNGSETYNADEIRYNFKSKKAVIQGVVTQQGEGYIHGRQVKKDPEDNLYIRDAIYTTCNLKHPHFHINANKIKVVHDKQIVTGPFNLVIADIPTPLGFGFGLFPFSKKRVSGIIVPTYGEEPRQRGFFLRDGGYYWATNEHMDMRFLGEIYSKGGWGLTLQSTYRKRYTYDGSLNLRFNKRITGDEGFKQKAEDFWIDWSHRPTTRGLSSFSASVSAGTSKFNSRNSRDVNSYLSNTFRSSVNYATSFRNTPFRMGINLQHDQNTQTGVVNLTLPAMNLSMNRIYPFKPKSGSGSGGWQETISFGFDFNGSSRISNAARQSSSFPFEVATTGDAKDTTVAFNLNNFSTLLDRAQIGGNYSIPLSASLKLFKYFSLNPSISLQGYVYPQRLSYRYQPNEGTVAVDTIKGLSNAYSFSTSMSLNTRIYGTYNFKGEKLQAIRHTMIPSVSLSYTPDFSDPSYGFYQRIQVNQRGDILPVSRYNGFLYGGPGGGKSGNVGFSLNNTLEAKIRAKDDSTGKKFEKVSLLNSFNFSGSYNLLADSMNLSTISISANTRILKKADISFSSSLDPYVYIPDPFNRTNETGVKSSKYAWQAGKGIGIGNLSFVNVAIGTSFKPGGKKTDEAKKERVDKTNATEDEKAVIMNNPDAYVDFNIPWSLTVSYSLNYSKPGLSKGQTTQTMNFSGDVSLTPKWKIGFSSGYDFVAKGISYTQVNIHRDLHCWEMSFNWTPFGYRQSYSFDLRVRSSILQDLKLSRRRSYYDRLGP